MSTCKLCGAADYEVSPGTHSVQVDLVYLDNADQLTPKLKRLGWAFKLFQGRPARFRMTCIDCLRAVDESQHAWKEINDERRDAELGTPDTFYNDISNY